MKQPWRVVFVLVIACAADSKDDALIVPQGLRVTALAGGHGVLELFAFTLREGQDGVELYAALENAGDAYACAATLSVELFDAAELPLAVGLAGLHARRVYRLADGSGFATCVAPGETTMAAITDLPAELALAEVRYAVYRCSYFALEVEPIAGLGLHDIEPVRSASGTAYRGTLLNALEVAVTNPSVTVFPTSRAGRPLGVARGREAIELGAGASWAFTTNRVDIDASSYVAYAAAALERD